MCNTSSDLLTFPERWAAAWNSTDTDAWVDFFSDDAAYIDHGVRIKRTGHAQLNRHHKIWRHSNPDFIMRVDPTHRVWWRNVDQSKGYAQCNFRTINTGTFKNDLPCRKASGKTFEYNAVYEFTIRHGRITRLDEWYTGEYDSSVPESQYE